MTTTSPPLLSFSTEALRATVTQPGDKVPLRSPALVVNPTEKPLIVRTGIPLVVPPLQSALLDDVTLEHPAPLLLITGGPDLELPGLGQRAGWFRIGDDPALAAGSGEGIPFPSTTPLWRSPAEELGVVKVPAELLGVPSTARTPVPLRLRANLWFAPAGTDCHIHRKHDFLEVHTQVAGHGRMQKFHAQDVSTRYQDVPLEAGSTHAPFGAYDDNGTWTYPWHRYWAETDCVWLALEYHPC